MDYVIIAFRSRENSIRFSEILKNNGVPNMIVNTPKEVNIGCGLSVRIQSNYLNVAKKILYRNILSSFVGFFYVKKVGNNFIVKSI